MRFLIKTDIEGVTGVTSYEQAERSQFGRDMLMNDLLAAIDGIRAEGDHEIVIYDMHTDGRNVDISRLPCDVTLIAGKPINGEKYCGIGGAFDGLFLVGLHAMAKKEGAMLAHSYSKKYDAIYVNDELVGEIGMERAIAGEQGFPLVFVCGDDMGCVEATALCDQIVTTVVKHSLGDAQALCFTPTETRERIFAAARKAVQTAKEIAIKTIEAPVSVKIVFSECPRLHAIKVAHPEIFVEERTIEVCGNSLLKVWSDYLKMEEEVVSNV